MNKKKGVQFTSPPYILKIDNSVQKEVFCGTFKEAKIKDDEYCQMALYSEKASTITYLSELFYGKKAITPGF